MRTLVASLRKMNAQLNGCFYNSMFSCVAGDTINGHHNFFVALKIFHFSSAFVLKMKKKSGKKWKSWRFIQ